jgi:hypothetical protein
LVHIENSDLELIPGGGKSLLVPCSQDYYLKAHVQYQLFLPESFVSLFAIVQELEDWLTMTTTSNQIESNY